MGNDVTVKIGAKQDVSKATNEAGSALDQMAQRGESAGKKMKTSWADVAGKFYLVKQAIEGVKKAMALAEEGAEFNQINAAFKNMANEVGVSSNKVISSLRAASGETISKLNLIKSASRADLLGLPLDKLDQLMKIARASATATGESVTKMFDDIVTGIGRGSPMILDNLGLTVKIGDANERYAASIGKTVAQLSAEETKMALLNEVLRSGEKIMTKVGEAGQKLTDAEKIQQTAASWANFKVTLGRILVPLTTANTRVKELLDKMTEFLSMNQDKFINFFRYLPEIATLSLKYVRESLKRYLNIDFLFNAFDAWRTWVVTVFKGVFETWWAVVKAYGTILWEPLKTGFEWIIWGIRELFTNMVNFFIDKINGLMQQAYQVTQAIAHPIEAAKGAASGKSLADIFGSGPSGIGRVDFTASRPGGVDTEKILSALKNVGNIGLENGKEIWEAYKNVWDTLSDPFQEGFSEFSAKMDKILSRTTGSGEEQTPAERAAAKAITNWEKLVKATVTSWETVKRIPQKVESWFKGIPSTVKRNVDAIVTAFRNPAETLETALGNIYVTFKEFNEKAKNYLLGEKDAEGNRYGGALERGLSKLSDVIQYLIDKFISLVTSTEAFQQIMTAINDLLKVAVEGVVSPLIEALRPLIDLVITLVANIAGHLMPVILMLGVLIKATMPLWNALSALIVKVIDVFVAMLPAILPFIDIFANVLTPVIQAILPLLDLWGMILSTMTPIFDGLAIAVKAVATPFVTVATVMEWVGDIITNAGRVIRNFTKHPLSPSKWDNGLVDVSNLGSRISTAVSNLWSGTSSDYTSVFDSPEYSSFSSGTGNNGTGVYGGNTTVQQAPKFEVHIHIGTVIGEDRLRIAEEVVQAIKERLGMGGTVEWLVAE